MSCMEVILVSDIWALRKGERDVGLACDSFDHFSEKNLLCTCP